MKVLITSGGTKIPIDRVRHIQNMSSGTFGAEIAKKALSWGWEVDFLAADKSKTPFKMEIDATLHTHTGVSNTLSKVGSLLDFHAKHGHQYKEFIYNSFQSYADHLEILLKATYYDAVILAAAVSDYGVENYVDGKVRSREEDFGIKLVKLPKLISKVKEWSKGRTALVGFKLLVDSTEDELLAAARKSIADNGCDGVIANDLRDIKAGKHSIRLVTENAFSFTEGDTGHLAAKVIRFTNQLIEEKVWGRPV